MKNNTSDRYLKNGNDDFFDQFSDKEKNSMKEVWELSRLAENPVADINDHEVEQDLAAVQELITESKAPTITWRWFTAAALLLLVLGAGMLFVPQTVTAPRGEIVKATLPDGSTVELNSGSAIEYNRLFSYTNRKIDLDGEAFFSVEEGKQPFLVESNGAKVKVTGTKFNVRSWDNEPTQETEIVVAEGVVQFTSLNNPENFVTLHEGEFSRWMATLDRPTAPEMISVKKRIGWRQYKLLFNDKSLQAIFNELERRFDTTIQLDADTYAHETLSAFYNNPSKVSIVLEDICRVKGLRYAQTTDGYRVYK